MIRAAALGAFAALVTATPPAWAEEVTIPTATGPATLPAAPQTVVALDVAAIDTLEALGVPLAGIPAPHYLDYLDDVAAQAQTVGSLFEPDFEALAVMAPDLVIAGGRSSAQVDALSRIAPTIDMTVWGDDHLVQVSERITAYGTLFDREDAAEKLVGRLEAKVAQAAEAVRGQGDALILLSNGGKVSAYGAGSRFGWLHSALDLPEASPGLSTETHGEAVSFEFVAEVDPDWILVIDRGAAIGQSGEAAAATLDNPLVAGTTAAQAGQIVYLDSGPLYIAGGGVQSVMGTLDELIGAFAGAEG
ncbi:siderophore ABC transporter substrate-binding protein [Pseudoponticoccus marisrubri]|uniref:Iron ABC transporter substrate-binding protein n=1 Tax=Pseudoponticoccus marisrubri TaxID=1685382 RepID=A0A0W7WKN5_9RHOB|nr:siderophore ABC transporter substrate-binding protein [Pseudoponticoccus marisrubri]KUF11079.1 iron ABC transporter substrate-binding protein [Pseudoponticoccus marisrubri]